LRVRQAGPGPVQEETTHTSTQRAKTLRFFAIAGRLPMDLQMVLCNITFKSPKDLVLTKFSEPEFKRLSHLAFWRH